MKEMDAHERAMYSYLGFEAAEKIANMETRSLNVLKKKLNKEKIQNEDQEILESLLRSIKDADYSVDVRICGVVRTQIRNLRRPNEIKIVVTKETLASILSTEVNTQKFLQWLKIAVLPSLAD